MFVPQQESNRERAKHAVLPDPQHLPPLTTPSLPNPSQPQAPSPEARLQGPPLRTSPVLQADPGLHQPPQGQQSQPRAPLHCGAAAPTWGHLSRSRSIKAPVKGSRRPAACLPAHTSCPRGAQAAAGTSPAPGHVPPARWGPADPQGWAGRTGSR